MSADVWTERGTVLFYRRKRCEYDSSSTLLIQYVRLDSGKRIHRASWWHKSEQRKSAPGTRITVERWSVD